MLISLLNCKQQYPDRKFNTTSYGAHVASMTTPDNMNNKRFGNHDDPIVMLVLNNDDYSNVSQY